MAPQRRRDTDPKKPFHSHRHTATSFLRNTLTPDGHPVVKEDVERYLTGHAGKGAHAGYGKQWIETLKAAIEIIPNPLLTPVLRLKMAQVPVLDPFTS